MPDRPPIRRGEILGERIDRRVTDEAEHYIRCPACGGLIDMRALGQVFVHEGPLPHPVEDRAQ